MYITINFFLPFYTLQTLICIFSKKENELVIQAALQKNKDFKLVNFMPQWKQRGLPIFKEGDFMHLSTHMHVHICKHPLATSTKIVTKEIMIILQLSSVRKFNYFVQCHSYCFSDFYCLDPWNKFFVTDPLNSFSCDCSIRVYQGMEPHT